jgi:MarR family transcriptional regulator, transcriptional regulator for hemolysin
MADDLGRILEQATQIWHKKLREALASQGPPSALGAGAAVLEQLGAGGLPQTQLTARMGLSKQAVQQLLDALEADELLVRVQDTVDRRIKHVQLTAAGQAAARVRQQAQAALELRCKDALGKKEFKRLRKSLRAVIDRNV